MKQVVAYVCDSMEEASRVSVGKTMAMADFVYCIKEATFIKHRYAPVITATQKIKVSDDKIEYWI